MIGQTVSHYRILEKLGEGGMGAVYLAEDTELDRKVALKFLPAGSTDDPEIKARFKREAKAAAALNHPNIVTIHEIGEHEGQAFLVMEHVEGQSLKNLVGAYSDTPLTMKKVIDIASQICEGLAAAHNAGVVHRDIKPDNVLITADGRAKIADFGLAKLKGVTRLTKEDMTMGTVYYMSPEQAVGEDVDRRSDIFSLGVVLYEMITGQLPFGGEYEAAISYSIVNEEPEPVARYKSGVSEGLQRVVERTLRKDPETRYQSATDLLADLREIKQQPRTSFVTPAAKTRVGYGRILLAGIGALTLLLIYGIFSGYFDTTPKSERKMLAVLPFENLGPPDEEYFADGITEEIISRLAGIRALGVISRTSIIQYKQTDKTLQQIGEELGVGYVLEGTVRWDHNPDGPSRVRVTPQLIRVSDDTHLWSDRYNAVLTDIFQVQSDIAGRVSEVLKIAVRQSERRSLESIPTENLEAYDTYLRGNDYFNRGKEIWSGQEMRIALQMYSKAVELDSTFALAYAKLSLAHGWMCRFQFDRTEERLSQTKETVDKALQLNPDLSEAHLALGHYYSIALSQHERAQKEFAIALEYQPNSSEVFWAIGTTQWFQGKFQEALPNFKKAAELNPRSGLLACNVGGTYMALRNFPEADRFHDRAVSLTPDRSCHYYCKAWISLNLERGTKKARTVLEQASQKVGLEETPPILFPWVMLDVFDTKYQQALDRLSSGSSEAFVWNQYYIPKAQLYAQIYGLMNQPQVAQVYYDSARIFLEMKLRERPEDARLHTSLGITYAGLGRKEDAIREGKRAVELVPLTVNGRDGPDMLKDMARIYVMVGEYDAAIDQIEFVQSIPYLNTDLLFELDPVWAPLRDHPRFQDLLRKAQ